jgi:hypothetical protein
MEDSFSGGFKPREKPIGTYGLGFPPNGWVPRKCCIKAPCAHHPFFSVSSLSINKDPTCPDIKETETENTKQKKKKSKGQLGGYAYRKRSKKLQKIVIKT